MEQGIGNPPEISPSNMVWVSQISILRPGKPRIHPRLLPVPYPCIYGTAAMAIGPVPVEPVTEGSSLPVVVASKVKASK